MHKKNYRIKGGKYNEKLKRTYEKGKMSSKKEFNTIPKKKERNSTDETNFVKNGNKV